MVNKSWKSINRTIISKYFVNLLTFKVISKQKCHIFTCCYYSSCLIINLTIITWIVISGRDPDHWFSRVSVLRHTGIVDALTEDRWLVVHIPHLHCQRLGGGERGQALVHRTDSQAVETLCLIVQRGREKQEAWKVEEDGLWRWWAREGMIDSRKINFSELWRANYVVEIPLISADISAQRIHRSSSIKIVINSLFLPCKNLTCFFL